MKPKSDKLIFVSYYDEMKAYWFFSMTYKDFYFF